MVGLGSMEKRVESEGYDGIHYFYGFSGGTGCFNSQFSIASLHMKRQTEIGHREHRGDTKSMVKKSSVVV